MIRHAFSMQLKPGCIDEYKRRHDEIWPDLARAHSDVGISDFSIFVDDETEALFAFQKLADNHTASNLKSLDIVKKWWALNSDLMETHQDNEPKCVVLREVFHMD